MSKEKVVNLQDGDDNEAPIELHIINKSVYSSKHRNN